MSQNVVGLSEVKGFSRIPEGSTRFGATVAPIADRIGLTQLGCMYTVVEPGRRAFPFHNHLGNDEMFVILEGEGVYRYGETESSVKAGDICGAPKGGPDTAHQLINTGSSSLRYLSISTRNDPDVVEYPDSGKFAAVAIQPGPDFMNAHLRFVGRLSSQVDYFDGEEL
ncbi:MAG: cupin domain-containing protein [Paracoccaceae bacterium]|nr:cupin domain-containing protein [Paracoccaceae bacterium]MDE2914446.1 cupin domain-containing protein [Paracoccaceae bacterium]